MAPSAQHRHSTSATGRAHFRSRGREEAPDYKFLRCLVANGDEVRDQGGFLSGPAFRKLVSHLIGPPLVEGNQIQELLNGDEFFPAMLEAIRNAHFSITIETYIWSSGDISDEFIEALGERARAGVRVHVIGDGMGMLRFKKDDMNRMKETGVQFVFYKRSRWHRIKSNLNHRTHRKLLVVDGRIGITGGICIDDRWLGDGTSRERWRDMGFRLEGPIVNQMQAVFVDNWMETTSQVLAGENYFPELAPAGNFVAQFFRSTPANHYGTTRLCFYLAIAGAEKHLRIAHAYFVPDDEAIALLVAARERGVKVEIIIPHVNDTAFGRAASRSRMKPLFDAGVEFFRFEPAMYHCKYFIADDFWATAGSSNFDNRSFSINDEANFNSCSREFAQAQIRVFERDKAQSTPYTHKHYASRAIPVKIFDFVIGLFWRLL